jgi:hypothetical protein
MGMRRLPLSPLPNTKHDHPSLYGRGDPCGLCTGRFFRHAAAGGGGERSLGDTPYYLPPRQGAPPGAAPLDPASQKPTRVSPCGRPPATPWLSLVLMCILLILSACGRSLQAEQTHVGSTGTLTGINTVAADLQAEEAQLRKFRGPEGWIWRISLPDNRLVVFYGNPLSPVMGPIGQYPDDELIAKLREQGQAYADLDPRHRVVPAIDYVTPVVQSRATYDGSWVYRMPDDSIEHYVHLANSNHVLFFFDMQIGHSPIQKEVNLLWPYLQMPGVDLSLDPEFDMPPGTTPGVEFGRMKAVEINWVIDQLSNLVLTHHLPPKILIIHQFLESMLPDWQNIKLKPGVQVITCVDGFGTPGEKIDDYRMFDKEQLIQYPGMKLFYKLDKPVMSPADVLALDPSPVMVMYQ